MTKPIGVFDSGVGGLTVLKALRASLPAQDFIYLGDTARLPYGTKSADSVLRYSVQCAAALYARDIGCLVVACNTASAFALDDLRSQYPGIPVLGVIEPSAAAAVAATATKHIVVIATEATINGGAYATAIHRMSAAVHVTSGACGLFVAMAEEGWVEGPIAEAVARQYLTPLFLEGAPEHGLPAVLPDTLVLGCTHFPVLAEAIRAALPAHVRIVDSAQTTAAAVKRQLFGDDEDQSSPHDASAAKGQVTWLATDNAPRFARIGELFLGEPLRADTIEIIDL